MSMTKQFNRDELLHVASSVRVACESLRDSGAEHFAGFPTDRCNLACRILGLHLFELGAADISELVGGPDGERHCWLVVGGIIVDITADQFDQPSVVVAADSAWHRAREKTRKQTTYDAEFCQELMTRDNDFPRAQFLQMKQQIILT